MARTRFALRDDEYSLDVSGSGTSDRAANPSHSPAVQRVFERVTDLLTRMPAEDLADSLSRAQAALARGAEESQDRLLTLLSEARQFTPGERAALDLENRVHAYRLRRELLEGSLTTSQVAKLLGTSRQTPHDRVRAGLLLGVLDQGRLRFPAWQFDPLGPDGVVDGLPQVIRALRAGTLGRVAWFVNPNPYLEGRSPLDALRAGERERVLDAARLVGRS